MADKQTKYPFTWLVAMIVLGGFALGACGGDDDTGDAASTGDGVEPAGDGETSDGAGAAWTDADLERLVTLEVDGYTLQNGSVSEFGNATVQYLEDAPAGPVALSAFVTFQACDPFSCSDLSAEIDEQRRENARSLLPRIHIDNPDLVEEIGPVELAGRTVLAIYFRSFVDQDDGQATANSYRAITHDGTNLITVQVSPDFMSAGGLADSAAELEEQMDADAGAAAAADILAGLSVELD
ncbi:MAG: hypothetical protein RIB98_15205 [Acidimicrobiales bacterium]